MRTLELEDYGTVEMNQNEMSTIDAGGIGEWLKKICEKAVKITYNGTLLDGIKGNTNIDCYLFGIKLF